MSILLFWVFCYFKVLQQPTLTERQTLVFQTSLKWKKKIVLAGNKHTGTWRTGCVYPSKMVPLCPSAKIRNSECQPATTTTPVNAKKLHRESDGVCELAKPCVPVGLFVASPQCSKPWIPSWLSDTSAPPWLHTTSAPLGSVSLQSPLVSLIPVIPTWPVNALFPPWSSTHLAFPHPSISLALPWSSVTPALTWISKPPSSPQSCKSAAPPTRPVVSSVLCLFLSGLLYTSILSILLFWVFVLKLCCT